MPRFTEGVSRREMLRIIAVSAAGGVMMMPRAFAQEAGGSASQLLEGAKVCAITPELTEGPYYFDPGLERKDITEGRPGLPVSLNLQVVDDNCVPLENARVDIWHCDATGLYSGYVNRTDTGSLSTKGETFLRGTQMTDATGIANFGTIYPGWYAGRTTHIHFKVFLSETSVMTGQIFFEDRLSDQVYAEVEPYSDRKTPRDTVNTNDRIAQRAGGASTASVEELPEQLVASMIIGVRKA